MKDNIKNLSCLKLLVYLFLLISTLFLNVNSGKGTGSYSAGKASNRQLVI